MSERYSWIYDRVVAGEVVSIDTRRRDVAAILNWINDLPSQTPNWRIQIDSGHDLMWIMQDREADE